jgi:hypothetical protein
MRWRSFGTSSFSLMSTPGLASSFSTDSASLEITAAITGGASSVEHIPPILPASSRYSALYLLPHYPRVEDVSRD